MNITDVGHMTDEVTTPAATRWRWPRPTRACPPWQIAEKYTEAFLEDADLLGHRACRLYPQATDHIPEMIALIEGLIEKGHAYEVGGTVYYDVTLVPRLREALRQHAGKLRAGHRQELEVDPNKRHPEDFALWKAAAHRSAHEVAVSPWGEGFPGWHIECSAMSMKLLGERFDIHTGGNDNKFPHHEDEIAQSEGAAGHQVVSTGCTAGSSRWPARRWRSPRRT